MNFTQLWLPSPDPLRKTATDANSVESIANSAFRIGRMITGSGY
jgi:hypothetical protein